MAGELSHWMRQLRQLLGANRAAELPDGQLLERFVRDREEEAFTALVRRHGPMVFNVCRRVLGEAHDAEDAFQATFLVLVRKAGSLRRPHLLSSWLYGVAYRVALKARVRSARRQKHERQAADMATPTSQPEASWRELRPLLDAEVNRLPDRYRAPLVLCYLQGRTNEQAAQELGWPTGTVTGRLARAREILRRRLARRGLSLSAGSLPLLLTPNASSAVLPLELAEATVQAALGLANAGAAAGVSLSVDTLMEGVLRDMFLFKLKLSLAIVLFVGAVSAGAALLVQQAAPDRAAGVVTDAAEGRVRGEELPAAGADPLPPGAVARVGSRRFVHNGDIYALAYAPDGKTLLTGGQSTIQLWNARTGQEIRRFRAHSGAVVPVAFAPDGKTIAAGTNDGTVQLWDSATGTERHRFNAHLGGTWTLTFTADGKMLASGGNDRQIRLWDVATGKELRTLAGHSNRVVDVRLSPDGRLLASASFDNTVRLWDLASGKEQRQFDLAQPMGRFIHCAAFAPDGKLLAGGGGNSGAVVLWEVATGKELHRLTSSAQAEALAFAPDGRTLAVGGTNPLAELWDVASGRRLPVTIAAARGRHPRGLCFTADARSLVMAVGNRVRRWDAATAQEEPIDPAQQQELALIALASDGKTLVSGGSDGTLRLWDRATGAETRRIQGPENGATTALAAAPHGDVLAAAWNDQTIRLYASATGMELHRLTGHERTVSSLAFAPDGQTLASGSYDSTARLWDVASGKERRILRGHQGGISRVAYSPDGTRLASLAVGGADRTARVWELASGRELCQVKAGLADEKTANLLPGRGPNFGARFSGVGFAADGQALITIEATVRFWDLATGKELRRLPDMQLKGAGVLSADARTLAAPGPGNTVALWELATGKERHRFSGHEDVLTDLAFARDGRTLVSASRDTTALVWDQSGTPKPRAEPNEQELQAQWSDLGSDDAGRAFQALWALVAAGGRSVPFLKERLTTLLAVDARHLARLLADLDSARFEVREKASRELETLGDLAEAALRKALSAGVSLEAGNRIRRLLDQLDKPVLAGRILQAVRAVETLEHIGTTEARQALESLARDRPGTRLGTEAKNALDATRRQR